MQEKKEVLGAHYERSIKVDQKCKLIYSFTNVLPTAIFCRISFAKKIANTNCKQRKAGKALSCK
jgi:hypothetical protein